MKHPSRYVDKEVVILGLAKSGVAAAKLFYDMGAKVTVNDKKERHLCPEANELEALGICVICGHHPANLIHRDVSLIVKNPGIPYFISPIQQAMELGIEVVTEVEVAYHLLAAPMIGITGSNGKTTTTTLVGLMLEQGGFSPIVGGNIGTPLCETALEAKENQWMVTELSSFQLKGIQQFRPRIGCLLNIYETHLDYHGGMEDYIASKEKVFANQTEDDIAVLNWDDPYTKVLLSKTHARIFPFSMKEELAAGVFLQTDMDAVVPTEWIVLRNMEGELLPILPVKEMGILGRHNIENAMAAICIAWNVGVSIGSIAQVLRKFHGVEHRLEFVIEQNGVLFYNDSKATNPTATRKTIEAFDQKIILIAGGMERGSDFSELLPSFESRVKAIITIGETSEAICLIAEKAGIQQIVSVDVMQAEEAISNAVTKANEVAEKGDIILLSPACASWDMFKSYEERGDMFKKSVHNL